MTVPVSTPASSPAARLAEARAVIADVPRLHPVTKRQTPTRYILGFEPSFTPLDVVPCPDSGHGEEARAVSDFPAEPCPENAESRVRNPDTNPVREPLREPVKEEEGAQARETVSEEFFGELIRALGLDPTALPGWWQGWPPREHIRRWRDDLGLDGDAILAVAEASRRDHPEPPDGPKALDRGMQRAAQRLKQTGAAIAARGSATGSGNGSGDTRRRRGEDGPRPSADEIAAFYAEQVNSGKFLPPSMISNTLRDAMLARGLVTAERLRERGVR